MRYFAIDSNDVSETFVAMICEHFFHHTCLWAKFQELKIQWNMFKETKLCDV
jgi:hypothetical protein